MKFSRAGMLLSLGVILMCHYANAAPVSLKEVRGAGKFHGINASGQIVESAISGDGMAAFLYVNGTASPVFAPTADYEESEGYGISKDGTVVGSYTVSESTIATHGFSFSKGVVTTIDYPGAQSTIARGINDANRIVGYYRDSQDGTQHGFVYDGRNFKAVDVPGAVNTFATGINNWGDIVGYYTAIDSAGQYHDHGFLFDHAGHFTTIDVNLPEQSQAVLRDTRCYGINGPGIIVGTFIDGNGTHGFVQNNGSFLVVDAPGTPPAVGTAVEGINDQGQLTVHGATSFVGSLP